MKKQIILTRFENKLTIANYSRQTINSYRSALNIFLDYVASKKVGDVSDGFIEGYLYYCKTQRNYSYSSMKHVVAAIRFMYQEVLQKPLPKSLNIKMRRPQTLPAVLSKEEVSKLIKG